MTQDCDWHEWTSCEFYGHNFVLDEEDGVYRCTDCGETTELD